MAERVYCLYRVSTAKQVDYNEQKQIDIPLQRKACREFAEKMGWTIVREEQEAGVSGFKVSAEDRDKIQLIKEHAAQDKFDILLVFLFDRLGRRADETPFVLEWFVRNGIRVWSVKEGEQRFDSHTDRLTNYIRFWQADGESQKTSIRTKTALGQMVREGRFRGGSAPYGYRLEKSGHINKRKHEVYQLTIDENEAQVVRMMYSLCVGSGYGRRRIGAYLNEQGIKNRTGGNWHEATVGHILHNVVYMGVLRSGETQSEIFPELQIIDPVTFKLAQKLMAERVNEYISNRTMPSNTRGQSLLSGNIFCGHCGGRLTLTTNGKVVHLADRTTKGIKRIRYVCYNKTRKRAECDGQSGYTMHLVDDVVRDIVAQLLDQMGEVNEVHLARFNSGQPLFDLRARLRQAQRDYQTAERQYALLKQELLRSLQGTGTFEPALLSSMLQETELRLSHAKVRMDRCAAELSRQKDAAETNRLGAEKLTWSGLFRQSDLTTQKMIAAYLIHRVWVFRDYALCLEINESRPLVGA